MGKNFSPRVLSVFAKHNTSYEQMNQLMKDLAMGRAIFDEVSGREISKAEANAKVLEFCREVMQYEEGASKKEMRRALRDNGRAFFDIIEDTVDEVVSTGFSENGWLNDLTEYKNIAYGDRQDFEIEEEGIVAVTKMGESHHDHILQRITPNQPVSIPTARYGVKIGADINKYMAGQVDWAKFIQAIAKAFVQKVQELINAQLTNVGAQLPAVFKGTGALSAQTKEAFDQLIINVQAANDGVDVVIMGTKSALKKITSIADVTWAAKKQKDSVAQTGTIGIYDGVILVEIPQRFTDKTFTAKVMDDTKLYVLPVADNKLVKFVDEGDTEITQVNEKGEAGGRTDDLMSYEVQRRFGAGIVLGRMIGQWSLA